MPPSKTLYCVCRKSDSSGFMIFCECCEEWFHGKCIGIKKKLGDAIVDYYCDQCRQNNPNLQLKYKPGYTPNEKKTIQVKQEPLEERKQEKKAPEKAQSTSAQPKPSKTTKALETQSKQGPGRRKYNQRAKSKTHVRKQCANPDCIYEARTDSKYCSHECGYAFNKLRYETRFIPKWQVLEKNHSEARLKKMKDLEQLEKDRLDIESTIGRLKSEWEELERNIKIIKGQAKKEALNKESANSKENDDEDAEMENDDSEEILSGDVSKTFCITCGHTIPSEKSFRHLATCHKKHEATYNFTADVEVKYSCKEDENPKLYCNYFDKKTKRFCMHIESACPQHSNWHSDKDEVCGCPLKIMPYELKPDGNYCLELKKDCNLHYNWDRFRLAQLNMQRIHAFTRLDAINEKIRFANVNLADTYGGVVGVMLHNTIDHNSSSLTDNNWHVNVTDE